MTNSPTIVCRVVEPLLSPIAAKPGELLLIWPGHPEHNLLVASQDGAIMRVRQWQDGRLYGDLLHLFMDGAITPWSDADAAGMTRLAS